jgi:hypothetical protein
MLSFIFATLFLVPFEANFTHMYIVNIMLRNVNIYGSNDGIEWQLQTARKEQALAFATPISAGKTFEAGLSRQCAPFWRVLRSSPGAHRLGDPVERLIINNIS